MNIPLYKKKIVLLLFILPAFSTVNAISDSVRSLKIARSASAIIIDGALEDHSWQIAEAAVDFYTHYPVDTSLAKIRTEVRMTYDDSFIYVGAKCYTHDEDEYIVESLRRDFNNLRNDFFSIILDPHKDLLSGFHFGVTPYGVKRESIIINGGGKLSDENKSWENRWFAAVVNCDSFWSVEIALPFNSIRYKEEEITWKINFIRVDFNHSEASVWNKVPRNLNYTSLAHTGELVWDEPPKKSKKNLALIPYASAGIGKDYQSSTPLHVIKNLGSDIKIGIGSSLNLDLTINPDFSQVEVDEQVTNIDRFEIFYPEKRQFFMENSDLFDEFGYQSEKQTIRPFFSRRIGISVDTTTGQYIENTLYAGARLSGRLNRDWRIGLMSMQAAEDLANGVPSYNYSVAAIQRRVFTRSNLSTIIVNKNPVSYFTDESDSLELAHFNRIVGADFNFASANDEWTGKVFYHHSFGPRNKDAPFAHGVNFGFDNKHWDVSWNHALVGADYSAEVGFVRRTGFKSITPTLGYSMYPNSNIFHHHGPRIIYDCIYSMKDVKLDETIELRYVSYFKNLMFGYLSAANSFIKLTEDFDPSRTGGTKLPKGSEYSNNYVSMMVLSDLRKPFSYEIHSKVGNFYNGNHLRLSGEYKYRFRPYGLISASIAYDRIRLPEPYHSANHFLFGAEVDITFSRNIYFTTLIQYNGQYNTLDLSTRFQWRFQPASDFYIVYTDNYYGDPLLSRNRAVVIKIKYWLSI